MPQVDTQTSSASRTLAAGLAIFVAVIFVTMWYLGKPHPNAKANISQTATESGVTPRADVPTRDPSSAATSATAIEARERILLDEYMRTYAQLDALRKECEKKRAELGEHNALIQEARNYLNRMEEHFSTQYRESWKAVMDFIKENPEKRRAFDKLRFLSMPISLSMLLGADDPIGTENLSEVVKAALATPEVRELFKRTIVADETRYFPMNDESRLVADLTDNADIVAVIEHFATKYRAASEAMYRQEFPSDLEQPLRFGNTKQAIDNALQAYIQSEENDLKPFYSQIDKTAGDLLKIRKQIRVDSAANSEIGNFLNAKLRRQ